MNREQLLSILDKYEEELESYGPASRADTGSVEVEELSAFRHVLWMLDEMRKMLEPFAEVTPEKFYAAQTAQEKVARWLGFVQGVLWSFGVCSIDEMRDLNRPK
jgi:hypothetical protein